MPVNKSLKWTVDSGQWTVSQSLSTFFLILIFCLPLIRASAQSSDNVKVKKEHHLMSRPARAMLYSAICPGLGQIYNHKYWKLPILYAGLGTAVYFIFWNQHYYNMYNNELSSYNPNSTSNIYSASELSDVVNFYHRDRDLSVIISVGVYLLSIVDANVDAQLSGFNVSEDISVKFSPNFLPNPATGSMAFTTGFTLVKKF